MTPRRVYWLIGAYSRWSTQTFTISRMTPVWIFPAYPLLIIGPHAGILSSYLGPKRALDIIIGGVTLQGIGYMVSLMIYSAFIYRLMTQKLPKESSRPGMFVSVGPSGFTVSGMITMADSAQHVLPKDFMGDGALAAMVLKVAANWVGIWVWGYVNILQFLLGAQSLMLGVFVDLIQSCFMVLLHLGWRTRFLRQSWQDDVFNDLVFVRVPEYSPRDGHLRRR